MMLTDRQVETRNRAANLPEIPIGGGRSRRGSLRTRWLPLDRGMTGYSLTRAMACATASILWSFSAATQTRPESTP
jgi:hypothetical protein